MFLVTYQVALKLISLLGLLTNFKVFCCVSYGIYRIYFLFFFIIYMYILIFFYLLFIIDSDHKIFSGAGLAGGFYAVSL